jgi:hypothetical protein
MYKCVLTALEGLCKISQSEGSQNHYTDLELKVSKFCADYYTKQPFGSFVSMPIYMCQCYYMIPATGGRRMVHYC